MRGFIISILPIENYGVKWFWILRHIPLFFMIGDGVLYGFCRLHILSWVLWLGRSRCFLMSVVVLFLIGFDRYVEMPV